MKSKLLCLALALLPPVCFLAGTQKTGKTPSDLGSYEVFTTTIYSDDEVPIETVVTTFARVGHISYERATAGNRTMIARLDTETNAEALWLDSDPNRTLVSQYSEPTIKDDPQLKPEKLDSTRKKERRKVCGVLCYPIQHGSGLDFSVARLSRD